MRPIRTRHLAIALPTLVLVLAACGGDDDLEIDNTILCRASVAG